MAKKESTIAAFNRLIEELKNRIYKPVYLLTGTEPYYIDKLSDFIANNVLDESEKAFNLTVLYGRDIKTADVINTARRFPMMANHQVVIVKEAQNLRSIDELAIYLKAPQPSTILVICNKENFGKKTPGLSKLSPLAQKAGVFFESKKLYDNQVPDWITDYLNHKGMKINPHAANLLTEYLGNDLSKIAHELDKLSISLSNSSKPITNEDIEQNIGISKDFNRFELTRALGQRDSAKAFRIADHFARNPNANPFVLTISAIQEYFQKLFLYHYIKGLNKADIAKKMGINAYFLTEYASAAKRYPPKKCFAIMGLAREYDLRGKGLNNATTTHGELLKELLYKIMN